MMAKAAALEDNKFQLISWPSHSHHQCFPMSMNVRIKEFSKNLYKGVAEDPTKPLPKLYNEVRTEMAKKMPMEDKALFFQSLPRLCNLSKRLYEHRSLFIPKKPLTQVSLCHIFDMGSLFYLHEHLKYMSHFIFEMFMKVK